MKGKRTDPRLAEEIHRLSQAYRPADVVKRVEGRVGRRTIYRILERLRLADEERRREDAEKVRRALEREEAERIRRASMGGAKPFRTVAQVPPRARIRAE